MNSNFDVCHIFTPMGPLMINTDKVQAALAATPLCKGSWTKPSFSGKPTKLCAVSALVAFAGVQPELIGKMLNTLGVTPWLRYFVAPVLLAEYGIPGKIVWAMPGTFDGAPDEAAGVGDVLYMCEQHNERIYKQRVAERERILSGSWPMIGDYVLHEEQMKALPNLYADAPVSAMSDNAKAVEAVAVLAKVKQKNAPWLGKKQLAASFHD